MMTFESREDKDESDGSEDVRDYEGYVGALLRYAGRNFAGFARAIDNDGMRYSCTATRDSGGQWSLLHESGDLGRIEVSAPTQEAALEKLRGEIRYRLELCPCTGESYQHIDIEISPSH